MVQTVKKWKDPHLVILAYRATPMPWCGLSPSKLCMGRRLRTVMPQTKQWLFLSWPFLVQFKCERYGAVAIILVDTFTGWSSYWVQRFRMRIMWFNAPGKNLTIADTLSRAPCLRSTKDDNLLQDETNAYRPRKIIFHGKRLALISNGTVTRIYL